MRVVLAALLASVALAACRIDLDHADTDNNMTGRSCKVSTAAVCVEGESHSDFAWIESKIFAANCFGSSCHTGPTASGKRDLTVGSSYATLMGPTGAGVMANMDATRKLVVPGHPEQSYLFFIIRGIDAAEGDPPFTAPPDNIGFMPMSNATICCQKIDAVERWIMAGAMND
jgi:hypothetical protein